MRQVRKRLTYANVMSSIAVFLVLGGGAAFAANELAKNSVGPKQLKKNAVTTAKIKKNAVTTAKIKKNAINTAKIKANAITGAKINEGTLGAVPSAVNAENAANFSRYFTSGLRKANLGETVTLASVGPFTIYGKCIDDGGGYHEAQTYITTSQPKSMMSSYEDSYDNFDFEPGEEAELGKDAYDDEAFWEADYYSYYSEWTAVSPDGSAILRGFASNGVHVFGSACAFNLEWTNAA